MNLYEYVRSNPANAADPSGLFTISDLWPGRIVFGRHPDWFLQHYVQNSGSPVFLTDREALGVMSNLGVRLALDNTRLIALGKARDLRCTPQGTTSKSELIPVRGAAVAEGMWRLVIQQFSFSGDAVCDLKKKCRCVKGWIKKEWSAKCHGAFFARDVYDFHAGEVLTALNGTPYSIIWSIPFEIAESSDHN